MRRQGQTQTRIPHMKDCSGPCQLARMNRGRHIRRPMSPLRAWRALPCKAEVLPPQNAPSKRFVLRLPRAFSPQRAQIRRPPDRHHVPHSERTAAMRTNSLPVFVPRADLRMAKHASQEVSSAIRTRGLPIVYAGNSNLLPEIRSLMPARAQ